MAQTKTCIVGSGVSPGAARVEGAPPLSRKVRQSCAAPSHRHRGLQRAPAIARPGSGMDELGPGPRRRLGRSPSTRSASMAHAWRRRSVGLGWADSADAPQGVCAVMRGDPLTWRPLGAGSRLPCTKRGCAACALHVLLSTMIRCSPTIPPIPAPRNCPSSCASASSSLMAPWAR